MVNNKIYIGSTINFIKRERQHRSTLKRNKHNNPYLQNSWNKYGESNFDFVILEKTDSLDNLEYKEQFWITLTRSFKRHQGYNVRQKVTSRTDKSCGFHVKINNIYLVKNKNIGKSIKKSSEIINKDHWWYNKKHTEETKKQMSKNHLGKNNPMYGKKLSLKSKNKLRKSAKKLNFWKVRVIKRLLKSNKLTQTEIAKIFSVSTQHISRIHCGLRWDI